MLKRYSSTETEPNALPKYVKVKKSPRARRLALRLDSKERIFNLVIPKGMTFREALAFAESYDSWMLEKLRALPRPINFRHGSVIPVLGRNRVIEVHYDRDLTSTSISLKSNKIVVQTNQRNPELRIRRFFRDLAAETLGVIASEKAARINREVLRLDIRDTKSRWGSCSEDGRMTLCWRLIFAPYEAYDYVVAHEVAHLVHMDHSNEFWALCRALSDDFIEGQYWMRNHGHELMRYGA